MDLLSAVITPDLRALRNAFVAHGFDLRIVGGAVRDLLMGVQPKDTDLCTDADPDEQITLYRALGLRYFETGLHHGTVTVLIDDAPVEITSLRTETDHDGRHATVRYTRDWIEDLSRRDLTVNAMALTFEGDLIDPFNGKADLKARRIRFVGDPAQRMQEDYLRILRWLRFHARLAPDQPLDADAIEAAKAVGQGLSRISRERVWSEASRMLSSQTGVIVLSKMEELGLTEAIGLRGNLYWWGAEITARWTGDPVAAAVTLLCFESERVAGIAAEWRWSVEDRDRGLFLCRWHGEPVLDPRAMVARDGLRQDWVVLLLRLRNNVTGAEDIAAWDVPSFPVKGDDLIAEGMKPGPEMGLRLRKMRSLWADSGYVLGKADLLACPISD